jgi:gluconate 2-dehydrogenase alpha chain
VAIKLKKVDVVIIGLGAGGGMASLPLARAGLNVVGLDAGPRHTGADYPSDEILLDIRVAHRKKTRAETPTVRNNRSETAVIDPAPSLTMNAVGGSTIHFSTTWHRFNPHNFKSRGYALRHSGPGSIPRGSALADWPLTYEELEPSYDKVDYVVGSSGQAGNVKGNIDRRGNIYEGPRSRPFPNPPLRRTGFHELLIEGAKRLGWHYHDGIVCATSREYRGRPACSYCGFCGGIGCHSSAKGSTDVTAIPLAEATKNLKVITEARVTAITSNNDGLATGVLYLKGGRLFWQPASVVVLSAYTYENVRLLLLSKTNAYPNGLSNNHGQVGKYFTGHPFATTTGFFPGRKLNKYFGEGAQGIVVEEFGDREYDRTGLGFIGDCYMDGRGSFKPISMVNSASGYPGIPQWGSAWKSWLKNSDSIQQITGSFEITIYEDDFLDLDPTHRDSLGLPRIRVTMPGTLRENERRQDAFLRAQEALWLKEAGAVQTWSSPTSPRRVNVHAFGGTRMGDDPDSSVVDRWGMSHEVPNLALAGCSVFVSTSHHHPAHTIEALGWRTADYIVKNWKSLAPDA